MQIQSNNKLVELVEASEKFCGNAKLICIDGPAGSGKTTLAKNLHNYLENSFIIHMDEIYDGWDDALNEKLVSNLHDWIILPMKSNQTISYKKFDWHLNFRRETVQINDYKFIVLEGVGSASSGVREASCLNLWIEGRKEILMKRVLERDGEQIKDEMLLWQVKEEEYFQQHDTKKHCDIWIDGNFEQEIDTASQFILLNR
ncbi:MAG: hypothetical protein RLZZ37_433 [Actinomycetota bacterium]